MVRYYDDTGVHDANIEKVWKLIAAHTDDNVGHIHPGFVKQRTREESPGVYIVDADVRGPDGKIGPMRLRARASPPHSQTIEFLEGPFRGWYTGVYLPDGPNRTRIVAVGDMSVPGLDDASALKAIDDFMEYGFAQDLEYLRKMR
jgi:hypothetical protein